MANLNFEQPPRSIANASLTSRAGGGGGLNSSTLTGHVTPTSGMFSGSSTSTSSSANSAIVVTNVYPGASGAGGGQNNHQPQQQQLSPMSSRGLFGQRAFTDRRTMPALGTSNPMGSMGTFGIPQSRNYGSQGQINNFHSVFGSGGGGDTSTPPLLDLSEFPSLTNRGQGDSMPQPSPMPGKQPYVGMVKQPTSESSEFTMSSEDFPALPGTQNREGPSPGGSVSGDKNVPVGLGPEIGQEVLQANRAHGSDMSQSSKRGIQTSPDGKVTNIPASMVKDQFGMIGLLTFIRAAETDPNLVSLALGQDLTALGLNLNSPENLYQNFGGPWAETPCRPQDIDFHVPPEYLINAAIRDKLAPVKLNRYKEDLLFYMFYTNVGDVLQLAAAAELYSREWRYHMEEKVWITQAPGLGHVEKTSTYERGTYYYFDAQSWRKVAKEFRLDYTKLESRPHLPTNFHPTQP
ncbi:PREDICTED: CCR4-NOT transcription complex subunit 2 [Dufourea novaeangliae]|uniref:CCR4-NOT transcription complex subunit 2 n=1 Tax=Dufourea novaeangliae TaxID=178035 RepID=A0A154P5X1_DUFNO|nr:PREDICTED: CCR4-NOT transcription complex subunit 2 [Dufourea novaeangliae]XP_015428736.1 PREDICTED: CCR4-NOT transcription complex subunit 2 [Dufourea novaeangliae]XP_015428737.1 PREDICTED: CCR4-NOT transcription complex subunit 2 [Dufourea novaeangliae]KZC07316.1 CCR4-NOT transcription complex subunit 2 [Dufourea novaeangliae]